MNKVIVLLVFLISLDYAIISPDAAYCNALGFDFKIAEKQSGDWEGICVLPNGDEVNAWDFFSGKIATEFSICSLEGLEIVQIEDFEKCMIYGGTKCAACMYNDGSIVELAEYMGLSFKTKACKNAVCEYGENFYNCSEDCPSGGKDDYCDALRDNKCDPDCSEESDPDYGDTDKDMVRDCDDNCVQDANPEQEDCNMDGKGDVCDAINPSAIEIPGNPVDENCDRTVLCNPNEIWKNHGKFVSCVATESEFILNQGMIAENQKDSIVSEAAQSDVGK